MKQKIKVSENKKLKNFYIEYYNEVMKKRLSFKNNFKFKNTFENKIFDYKDKNIDNIDDFIKQDYNWLVFNSISLEKRFSNDDNFSSLFLTLTLNSSFNKYKQTKNKIILNKKYKFGNTVNLGYKLLNDFFYSTYKNFKVNGKYEKLYYLRVIEPNKASYTPHLHAVIYIKKEFINLFINYLKKRINKSTFLGSQFDIEKINNISRTSSYILKYMQKSFTNSENKKAYYGWKWYNKIRAFTFSKSYLNREIFDKISFHFSKDILKDEEFINEFNTNNYYKIVDMFTSFNIKIFDKNILVNTSDIKAKETDLFIVNIEKERIILDNVFYDRLKHLKTIINYSDKKDLISLLKKYKFYNKFNHFVYEILNENILDLCDEDFIILLKDFIISLENKKRYIYNIKNYTIYKKAPDNLSYYNLVYNKKDWLVI